LGKHVIERPIRDKADMYRRLAAGQLGNTTKQYFTIGDWFFDQYTHEIEWWGVRTQTPGGPCKLNCHRLAVIPTALEFLQAGHGINISMMVDRVAKVRAWLELVDLASSPFGVDSPTLTVEGIEYPDTDSGMTWRNSMPNPALRKRWEGKAAKMCLLRYLNSRSIEEIDSLLLRYPGHVIELSALDQAVGDSRTMKHVVLEIRDY
jgi:hypothetical protein